jgi:hypothetical protein
MAKQTPPRFLGLAVDLHSFFTSLVIKTTDKTRTTNAADFIASQEIPRQAEPSPSPFFGGGFMNRLRSAFLGLGLLLVASGAQAQETYVKANIPFDFVVGNQILAAGEYMVASEGATNQAIVIRSNDSKTAILSLTNSCTSSRPSENSKLVFHRLAGRYFLSQVWVEGNTSGRQVLRSKAEIEMAKNNVKPEDFVLAAVLTR